MNKHIVSISFLALVGCIHWSENPTHKYQLSINLEGLTRDQASVIANSAQDWTNATGGYILFYTSTDYQPLWPDETDNVISIHGEPDTQIQSELGASIKGECWSHGEPSVIVVLNDSDDNYLRRIATHEIGHALGLAHSGKDTIMYWNTDGAADHITCADVAQLCLVWNAGNNLGDCDPTDMPVCKN